MAPLMFDDHRKLFFFFLSYFIQSYKIGSIFDRNFVFKKAQFLVDFLNMGKSLTLED